MVVGVLATGLIAILVFPDINPFRGAPEFETLATLLQPPDGAVVPLHGTFNVSGEAISPAGVAELVLYVNGQPWGAESFTGNPSFASDTWLWTPSGEGIHELYLRAIDGDGQVSESATARVQANADADVRFPLDVTSEEGDTVNSLAATYGVDPSDILEAAPGPPNIDPDEPLPPGTELSIPVPVPNADPAAPESGAPPAPPAEPVPNDPEQAVINFIPLTFQLDGAPNFIIVDGKLVPDKPVDRLYIYASVEGESPWRRIPSNPDEFLPPEPGGFDFSDYVDFAELEASPTPLSLDLEAWGWQGETLIALGSYHGLIGGGLQGWPPSTTQLHIVEYETLGIPHYVDHYALAGEAPSFELDFEWQASQPAFFVRRQVATLPFPNTPTSSPPGLLLDELMWGGEQGEFSIDFAEYFQEEAESDSIWNFDTWLDELTDPVTDLGLVEGGKAKLPPSIPVTFYVRILEMSSQEAGPQPSNTVVVHYLPSGEVLAELDPSGPIYQVALTDYTPYRPLNPNYTTCTVASQDIDYQFALPGGQTGSSTTIPAGTLGCGCPGVECSSGGGSSCGWEPWNWGNCIADAGEWFVNAVKDLANFAANLYNDAKAFVVDTLASAICGSIDDKSAKQGCELAVNAGVNAGLAAMGLPPEIPNFEELFDEGLEYAIAAAVSQVSGFECDQTCRDLLKNAYQGVTHAQEIYEQGWEYGLNLALSGAEAWGLECDAQCEQIISQGVQAIQDPQGMSEQAIEQLAQQTAQDLIGQGYPCSAECQAGIADSLKQGLALGEAAAASAGQAPTPPAWGPHPLGLEQPAIVNVEVFRRFESAQLNSEIIADRCSGFSLDNYAHNETWNIPLEGRLFDPRFVQMPLLQPGESITIPVVLEHTHWQLPPGVGLSGLGLPAWLLGYDYQSVGSEGGEPIGQVQITDYVDDWRVLYYGSTVEFTTYGPYMLDVVDGQSMSLPCFVGSPQTFGNLQP